MFRTKGTSRELGEAGLTGKYVWRGVSEEIQRAPKIWDELDRVGGSLFFFSWVLSLNKKGSLIHVTDTPHRLTALSSCSSCEGCSQLQVTLDHNVLRAIKPKFWLTCQLKIPAQAAVKLV